MIRGIKFASVPVSDQDRALEFYCDVLGFRVATDAPFDENQRWIELAMPDDGASLVLFTMHGQEDRIGTPQHVTFYATDVVGTCAELKERGVEFVQDPKIEEWGTSAVFRDPDGNVFVVSSR